MAANNACRACAQSPVLTSLTDQKPSPSIVLRVHHTLEVEFESWKNRPLQAHYRYLFADGIYFSVIYDGQEHKIPILAVIGISLAGEREVLRSRWVKAKTGRPRRASVSNTRSRTCSAMCPRANATRHSHD